MPSGSLSFALLTLGNVDLAAKTVTPKAKVGHEVRLAKTGTGQTADLN